MPKIHFTRRTSEAAKNKVSAIKNYRFIRGGVGLKEARDAVEEMLANPETTHTIEVTDITPDIWAAIKVFEDAGYITKIQEGDPYSVDTKNMEFLIRMLDNSVQEGRYYEATLLMKPLTELLQLCLDRKEHD